MTISITRHEQSALMIQAEDKTLAIDFGTLTPAERLAHLPRPDAALVSHQHGDHFAPEHLRAFGAPVLAPQDVISQLPEDMSTRVLRAGETVEAAGFTVTPIEVDHGPKLSSPIENLGFVITCPGGHAVLFAGDIARPGALPEGTFDTVVLPVGGAGFVFDAVQAHEYLQLIGHQGMVIPVHDTGPADPGAIDRFVRLASKQLKVIALGIGQSTEVQA